MDANDWRTQLLPDSRQRIVNKMSCQDRNLEALRLKDISRWISCIPERRLMDTLKKHLPISGPEGLLELRKIAQRFEEKIFTAATSQPDYLRKISLKMLTMETKSQNNITTNMPPNQVGPSNKPPDQGKSNMKDSNNWRLNQSTMDANDWRPQLMPGSRRRIVSKM